jgi:hypothetical protein
MSAKYYTQFILTDTQYRDGNEFSGVVELSFGEAPELVTIALVTSGVLAESTDSP